MGKKAKLEKKCWKCFKKLTEINSKMKNRKKRLTKNIHLTPFYIPKTPANVMMLRALQLISHLNHLEKLNIEMTGL